MPDNVTADSGDGAGVDFGTDLITSVHYPRIKLIHGEDGTNDGDVSTANPLPGDQRELGGVAVPVDDTATLTSGTTPGNLIMGAATPTDGSVDANDIGAVAMSTDRRLHVDAQIVGQDADVTIADGGNSITVDNADITTVAGAVHVDDAAFTLGTDSGVMVMGFAGTQSVNANDAGAIAIDTDGAVHISDGGNTITVDGTVDLGTAAVTNAGTFVVQEDGAALTALQVIDNVVHVDDAAFTLGTDSGVMMMGFAGTQSVNANDAAALACDTSGALHVLPQANDGVDIGDVDVASISAGSNLIGDVGISGARTSGGTTLHTNNGTSTLTQVNSGACQLYWLHVISLKASVLYLQVFNLASASVTLGTTTPDLVFPIPTQGDTNGAGFTLAIPNGIALGTGLSYAVTTAKGGATTASSDEAFVNLGYAS